MICFRASEAFSLGLERTGGFETVAFCEIEPFCQKILKKHWPEVPIYDDVRTLTADALARDGIAVDVITGGFPCQDVSLAGRRAGLAGARSGLWAEYARLIGEIRPRFVIVENTPGLLSLGMDVVLGDLASIRYDAEWSCIPACYVGADHIRDRVWIISYPADRQSVDERGTVKSQAQVAEDAADAVREGLPRRRDAATDGEDEAGVRERPRLAFDASPVFPREYREHKPVLGRGVYGVPNRVDRIRVLGNVVVPQIPEMIGHAILQAEKERNAA